MKPINRIVLFITAALALAGCSHSFDPAATVTAESRIQEQEESRQPITTKTKEEYMASLDETSKQGKTEGSSQAGKEREVLTIEKALALSNKDYIELPTNDAEAFVSRHTSTANYVGIKGHIKEVHEDQVLICSDTSDYPGVFWVLGIQDLANSEELKGGTTVFVLMRDLEEKEEDGIGRYIAKEFFVSPEEENRATHDILLTDVPPFELTDVLSSTYESFEIRPGNYTWNSRKHNEGVSSIACGAMPLEEAASDTAAKLKLPRYNGIDYVGYSFSTKIQPDRLTVRQWSAEDIGNGEAQEECVSAYYHGIPFLELKPGKVYEFTAEWKKENQDLYQFSGTASYVLVTE